jgi:hypothetical protein
MIKRITKLSVIICFVIIQIPLGNGHAVESYGYVTFRKRIVQQRIILSYKLLTYYLLVKNANLHKTRSDLKYLQFNTFLYISIWVGILVLDSCTPSGAISYVTGKMP